MKKIKLKISGMHCGSCAAGIQMILSSAVGIKTATVNHDAEAGEVEFDESKINQDDVIKYVSDLGYHATTSA